MQAPQYKPQGAANISCSTAFNFTPIHSINAPVLALITCVFWEFSLDPSMFAQHEKLYLDGYSFSIKQQTQLGASSKLGLTRENSVR